MSLLLKTSWTTVAAGYRKKFVPRFAPWVNQTVSALSQLVNQSPSVCQDGTIFVAGCGEGSELSTLAESLPNHQIIAVDLAPGMVDLAQSLVDKTPSYANRIQIRQGDASIPPSDAGPFTAVFSCFVLQQMPDPKATLAAWIRSLSPGGILSVCYWPNQVETNGPWQRLRDITPMETRVWDDDLAAIVHSEGGQVIQDSRPAYKMTWPSADAFWQAMVYAGPWNSRLLKYGEVHMEELHKEFMKGYSDDKPIEHSPAARLLVVRKNLLDSSL